MVQNQADAPATSVATQLQFAARFLLALWMAAALAAQQPAPGTSADPSGSPAVLAGEVVNQFGEIIAGASVVLSISGGQVRETTTDATGGYRFDAVPPGDHRLTVDSPGFAARTLEVQVNSRSETRQSVELALGGVSAQVTVTAPNPDGYDAPRAAAATRLNIPILETPVSVQVVPNRVIKDQNALGLEEIYTNISGVAQAGNTLNAQTEVRPMIRGFEAGVPLRNGLRATTVGAVDPVNIESVEVLKGPASILYGALEPGGVLNYTTKKPLMAPRFEIAQQFGSYDHIRTTADATGPLNRSRTMAYRVNFARQDSGSFRDFIDLDRIAVSPSVTIRPDERNELFVDFSFTDEEVPYDTGVPFGLDGGPIVPISTFFGDPDLAGRDLEDYFTSVQYFRRLTGDITARTQFQFHRVNALNESIRPRAVGGEIGAETLSQRYQNEDRTDDDYQFVGDVISTFELGATRHQTLVGLDLAYQDSQFLRFRQNIAAIPITGNPQVDFDPPANQPLQEILGTNRWAALYFQDQISMLNQGRLKLLVGARYDTSHGESRRDDEFEPETDASKLTGRFGVGYQVIPGALAFASVSQSFLPQNPGTVDADGRLLDPQTGLQYEGGLKFGLFGGRFISTVSAYHIKKENVPLVDLPLFMETGEIVYFPGVAERSQGFEIDLAGRITNSLSMIANYAHNDAETVENATDPSQIGRTLGNTPAHLSRLWLTYDAPFNTLRGLGGGIGVRAQSSQFTQFDDLRLPGYGVWDLGLWYRLPLGSDRRVLRFAVNIQNLFDKEFYLRASTNAIVHPGAPRSAITTIGFEF
jgi:iron complex outermembrane receptor protein